jgi:hypothetical protein
VTVPDSGRRLAYDLLDSSATAYEGGVELPYGQSRAAVAAVGLAARCRGLTRAVHTLFDADMELEAQITLRALMEYAVTLQWIAKEPDARFLSWWRDDDRIFEALRREVTNRTGLSGDLDPEAETEREKVLALLREESATAAPLPRFVVRAQEVESGLGYSLIYRSLSQAGAHPAPAGIHPLIEDRPEKNMCVVRPRPIYGSPFDSEYLAALFLLISLREAGELFPPVKLDGAARFWNRVLSLRDRADG